MVVDAAEFGRRYHLGPEDVRAVFLPFLSDDGQDVTLAPLWFDLADRWVMEIDFPTADGEWLKTTVPLELTRPPLGGLRLWFRCPTTGRRVQKLYRPPRARYFASREAHNLAYATQRLGKVDRMRSRLDRIASALGGAVSVTTGDLPPRPPGMRRATYARLREQAAPLIRAIEEDVVQSLAR